MRKFNEMYIGSRLQEALNDPTVPPLPLAALADQLGYDQSFLSSKLPELCNAITDRYLKFRQARKAVRIQRLCSKVRREVFSLYAQGIFPSKHRLARSLHKALLTEPVIFVAYQQAMRDIGYEMG